MASAVVDVTAKEMIRAAAHLREYAAILEDAYMENGKWPADSVLDRIDHEDQLRLAAKLEALARWYSR